MATARRKHPYRLPEFFLLRLLVHSGPASVQNALEEDVVLPAARNLEVGRGVADLLEARAGQDFPGGRVVDERPRLDPVQPVTVPCGCELTSRSTQ